jgi:hypothetical protein
MSMDDTRRQLLDRLREAIGSEPPEPPPPVDMDNATLAKFVAWVEQRAAFGKTLDTAQLKVFHAYEREQLELLEAQDERHQED